jgi:hypothetical protein
MDEFLTKERTKAAKTTEQSVASSVARSAAILGATSSRQISSGSCSSMAAATGFGPISSLPSFKRRFQSISVPFTTEKTTLMASKVEDHKNEDEDDDDDDIGDSEIVKTEEKGNIKKHAKAEIKTEEEKNIKKGIKVDIKNEIEIESKNKQAI